MQAQTRPVTATPVISAPWTKEQVAAFNRWQNAGGHPFTCPNDGAVLVATSEGWTCAICRAHTQDWAHGFMLAEPRARALVKTKVTLTLFVLATLTAFAYLMQAAN